MVGTAVLRSWWSGYRCLNQKPASLRRDISLFDLNAGYCAAPMLEPFTAFEQTLLATGYTGVKSVWVPRNCPLGIGGGTCTSSGAGCSLHNYGIAVDIDPFVHGNPHFQKAYGDGWTFANCKIQRHQVEAVEAIRNTAGEQLFRWLGWSIGDTMHFETQTRPTATQVNWATVPGGTMSLTAEEEAFVRKLKAQFDDADNPGFADEFAEAQAAGIFSAQTKPSDAIYASKLAVFLKRAGALPVPPSSGGVTLTQVRNEIKATTLTPKS